MTRPINHVMISVSDLEASIAFYRDALGMELVLRTHMEGEALERMTRGSAGTTGTMALLRGGSKIGQVELIQWEPAEPIATDAKLRTPGRPMLSFEVETMEELEQLHAQLTAAGFDVWSGIESFPLTGYGIMNAFLVSDPDGTAVEFVVLPTREQVKEFLAAEAAG